MRGIDFYNIPTTLLSQLDSSIGGKTAVDLDGIKNSIGAFHAPRRVLIVPICSRRFRADMFQTDLLRLSKCRLHPIRFSLKSSRAET